MISLGVVAAALLVAGADCFRIELVDDDEEDEIGDDEFELDEQDNEDNDE